MINFIKKVLLLLIIIMCIGFVIDEDIQGIQNDYKNIDNHKTQLHKACQLHQFDNNIKNICFDYEI